MRNRQISKWRSPKSEKDRGEHPIERALMGCRIEPAGQKKDIINTQGKR